MFQGNIALLIRYRIGIVIGNGQLYILRGILWKNCCNLLPEYKYNRVPFGFLCFVKGASAMASSAFVTVIFSLLLVIAVFKEIFCIQPTVWVWS